MDQVFNSEVTEITKATGVFEGIKGGRTSSYQMDWPASRLPQTDSHYTNKRYIKASGGILITSQVHVFWDKRTGSKDVPVTNSGYVITKEVKLDDKSGKWYLYVVKIGAKTTAQKVESNAGGTKGKVENALLP